MIGGVYPAQAAPGQIGVGPPRAATLTAGVMSATAAALSVTTRSGTVIMFSIAVASEALLLPYARTGSVSMSMPRMLATATITSLGLIRSAALRAEPLAATAVFPEIGGTGRGATFSAEVMTAEARGVAYVPWVTIGRGVRTVLAAPRRLTVLARAGVERGE